MNKTILIVDDSASVRQVLSSALLGAGYQVIAAGDGEDALAMLDGRRLNLVICDVNMPRLDGLGFVRQMKAHPDYKFTPVIMLTTESARDMKEQGRDAGARAWVVKPFPLKQMMDAVSRLVLP